MGLGLTKFVPIIVYFAVYIIIFIAALHRVEFGLLFLIPLTPWQSIWYKLWIFPLGTRLIDLIMASLLIGWYLQNKNNLLESSNIYKPLVYLFIVTFLGLFINANSFPLDINNPYFKFWKNFIYMPLLLIITYNTLTKEKYILCLVYLMALSMLANDFYFYTTFKWYNSEHFYHQMRISTFKDLGPNEMASFTTQGTVFLIPLLFVSRIPPFYKILIAVVILGNLYQILYSFSRGAYLAFFSSFLIFSFLKKRSLFFILIIFLLSWQILLPNAVVERIKMTEKQEGQLDHASAVRIEVWKEGLHEFLSNPLGKGFAKFRTLGMGDTGHRDAHNILVKIFVELGIQGFIVLLYLYYISLKDGFRLFKLAKDELYSSIGLGFMLCTISNFICNFFGQDWLLFNVTTYYWVFWAITLRLLKLNKKYVNSPSY